MILNNEEKQKYQPKDNKQPLAINFKFLQPGKMTIGLCVPGTWQSTAITLR